MFDEIAKQWDSDKRIDRAKFISEEILDRIKINNTMNGLEFGCGTGLISFNFQDKLKNITLIDPSKGMIDVLREKIDKTNTKNMTPLQGDIETLIESGETYDFIYTSMVLHHVDDSEGAIKNLSKLLNKDGYLCIVDLDKENGSFHGDEGDFHGHNGFDQEEIKNIFSESHLSEISIHTFYKGIKENKDKKVDYSLFIAIGRK